MKQRFINVVACAFFLFALIAPIFAADGVMSGEKDIRVVQTTYFDIIYALDSAASAAHLAKHADAIYEDVCASFETEAWKRYPVVITSAQDEFNAYFSPASYDTIVMFDTPVIENLAVGSDDFLLTFRHELTHAVTYNLKNNFWRGVSRIFGDVVNPAYLFITRSRTEGAAVASESASGEGRLNDSYSLQMVRQAKLEELFPNYADIYGSRDIYPTNTNYYFGAAFEQWIQKTYGMKRYAQFLYKCVNFQTIHANVAFKSVFGISMKEAWRQFYDSIEVPNIHADPLAESASFADGANVNGEHIVRDFVHKYKLSSERGFRYAELSSSDAGFGYVDLSCGAFYFSRFENGSYSAPRKLFSAPHLTRAVLSRDGVYIAVSEMSRRYAVPKSEVHIFNVDTRRWFRIKETGLRDAAFVSYGDAQYLCAIKTKSQSTKLVIYKLLESADGGRIAGAEKVSEKAFPRGDVAFTPIDAGNGDIAYIYKSGINWSINIYSMNDGAETEFAAPLPRMVFRDISLMLSGEENGAQYQNEKSFAFSWAAPNTMPRLGILTITKNGAEMRLDENDISGGVYNPITLPSGLLAYTGQFFRDNRLFVADFDEQSMTRYDMVQLNLVANANAADNIEINNLRNTNDENVAIAENAVQTQNAVIDENACQQNLASSKSYNPFPYYARGILLPISLASSYTTEEDKDTTTILDALSSIVPQADGFNSRMLPLGVTYSSNNPWSSKIVILSGGYSLLTNSGALETTFSSGTATSLFKYTLKNQIEFDRRGFKQTAHSLVLSSLVPVGSISSIVFKNSTGLLFGKQSRASFYSGEINNIIAGNKHFFAALEGDDDESRFAAINKFSATWTNVHKTGAGYYERGGVSLEAAYNIRYETLLDKAQSRDFYQNISVSATVRAPKLLPYSCIYGFTYNVPFAVSAVIFPQKNVFWQHGVEAILFAGEVQKAIPLIYVNRYSLRTSYTGRFEYDDGSSWNFLDIGSRFHDLSNGNMDYYDSVALQATLTITPNFGAAATPLLAFTFSAGARFRINKKDNQKPFAFELGFNAAW